MIDLRSLPSMPVKIELLRNSRAWRQCRRQPELAFYLWNMWMAAWHDNVPCGSLPDDEPDLMDAADADAKTWRRLRTDLMRKWFKGEDGRWYHPVLVEIAADVDAKRAKWRADKARTRGGHDGGTGGGQHGGHRPRSGPRTGGHGAMSTAKPNGHAALSTNPSTDCPPLSVSVSITPLPPTEPDGGALAPEGRAPPLETPVIPALKQMPGPARRTPKAEITALAETFGRTRPLSPSEVRAQKLNAAEGK